MTKKRFVSEDDCYGYYTEIIDNEKELDLSLYNPKRNLTIEELVDLLNKLNNENIELHIQNDFLKDENTHMRNVLNENKQLKQRNENQYKQLNKLWGLIQAKDWETLTAMDNQMKEDEERLQKEWKCYE